MRLRLQRSVLPALLCLWSSVALCAERDPLNTEASLPLKPALRLGGAVGDPCADAAPRSTLNLFDVVNLALCNNPQTREVWASSRVQAAQVGVSKGSYFPAVSLSASGNRNSPGTNQRTLGLTLSYLLYDFGARAANLESARQLLAAASSTQDSTVQVVFLSAVQAYYQTQATQAALDATREAERAAKGSFDAAEARYLAGSATPADKLQAQTAYSQATLNRITAEGTQKKTGGTLANIIGLDANRSVTLAAANSETVPPDFDRDVNALIDEAKRQRPDLIAAEAQVKAAEASADAARAAGKPSISLTASTTQANSAGITSHGSSLGVNLSVPLFSGFAPTYRVRAAEAQVEAQQAQMERVRSQVALDVWNAYQNLITATQSLRTTADLLHSAEQSERVALGRYQAGVGSILDVLNAQSALASARQQRIQSMLDWNIGRATLAQAMGNLDGNLLQTLSPAAPEKALP
ncbi:protein CyaE [Ferrigenium kumadai]|uniref:Protein CyaE n=1 Tax=Ferrigenium kumadai TaxID=1682490 RepID=A0AAN1VZP1_9PROT|nr:TolC family protein [Ferrigenium kumadai]BBI99634.1 protein CyaE [Ferrigenium kumadai]